jgi:GT2 family glycosyltransferase
MPAARIAALLTCHNRREKTLACLRSLKTQSFGMGQDIPVAIEVFLVDDGSSDGTAEAVCALWPETNVIVGDGNLFWCGGMRKAWNAASATDPDFYLLLNDDTVLFSDAIRSLLTICPTPETQTIAVGAICDPESGDWTYGGLQSDEAFKNHANSPRLCRTMNGNCTLVPRTVFKKIGIFFHGYRHAMGDMDYGILATKNGIKVIETPLFVGKCKRNATAGTWQDKTLTRFVRLKKLISHKGLPPRDWFFYCWRNCGLVWLRYFFSPYLRVLSGN